MFIRNSCFLSHTCASFPCFVSYLFFFICLYRGIFLFYYILQVEIILFKFKTNFSRLVYAENLQYFISITSSFFSPSPFPSSLVLLDIESSKAGIFHKNTKQQGYRVPDQFIRAFPPPPPPPPKLTKTLPINLISPMRIIISMLAVPNFNYFNGY